MKRVTRQSYKLLPSKEGQPQVEGINNSPYQQPPAQAKTPESVDGKSSTDYGACLDSPGIEGGKKEPATPSIAPAADNGSGASKTTPNVTAHPTTPVEGDGGGCVPKIIAFIRFLMGIVLLFVLFVIILRLFDLTNSPLTRNRRRGGMPAADNNNDYDSSPLASSSLLPTAKPTFLQNEVATQPDLSSPTKDEGPLTSSCRPCTFKECLLGECPRLGIYCKYDPDYVVILH